MRVPLVRFLNSETFSNVLAKFRTEAPPVIEAFKEKNKKKLYEKLSALNSWYTKTIGLDEVKKYQERVVALQERLLTAQEKRREIGRKLAETRAFSNKLQDEIHKTNRSKDVERFLDLMREETQVLRLENEINRQFQDFDQAERELFTAFTNAVRDSYEKQRSQLEYTKYFGIILSIVGSFLTFCYSSLHKGDLKRFIEENIRKSMVESLTYVNINDRNAESARQIIELVRNETSQYRQQLHPVHQQKQIDLKDIGLFIVGGTIFVAIMLKAIVG